MANLLPYEPAPGKPEEPPWIDYLTEELVARPAGKKPEVSPIIKDAFFDALNPMSSTAIAVKEDGSVAIKANQPPPEAKSEGAAGVTKPAAKPGVQPPAAAGPTPETQALTPLAGFGPALAALAGPQTGGVSAATLTGLTPEQITGLLGAEAQKQKLRQGTIGQLLRIPYFQALTAKALRPPVTEAAEQWTYEKDPEGNYIRRNKATGKTELITRAPTPKKPTDRYSDPWTDKHNRLFRKNLLTNKTELVAGAPAGGGKRTQAEKEAWLRVYDTLRSFTHDDEGNPLDQEDQYGINMASRTAQEYGLKLVEIKVPKIIRDLSVKLWKPKVAFRDTPARSIYMVVKDEKGVRPSDEDILDTLRDSYGYDKKAAERALYGAKRRLGEVNYAR